MCDTKGIVDMDRVNELWDEKKKELHDRFKSITNMEEDQWSALQALTRTWVTKQGCTVDPLLHDYLLLTMWDTHLDEKVRDSIIFKDESGDFFLYNEKSQLWIERDAKNAPSWLFSNLGPRAMELIGKEFLFTNSANQKNFEVWVQKVFTYSALANLLKLRSNFPEPRVKQMNCKEWIVPLQKALNYDCKELQTVKRAKEDYFSAEAGFEYLKEFSNEEKCCVNADEDRKKLKKMLTSATGLKNGITIMELLRRMFPNAMKLVSLSFADLDRRWFFLLRLGMMLSNTCAREILFLYGKGKGGKSTIMFNVLDVLGDLATPMSKQSFVKVKSESGGSSHTTDLCKAAHRRLVVVDELESSDSMKEALLKNWASHQPIAIREIFKKQSSQVMKAYLTFLTNSPPRFSMDDQVIMERTKAVKVTTKFFTEYSRDTERPKDFISKDTWVDKYNFDEDIFWVYQTGEGKKFISSFKSVEERKNELGTFLCILSSIAYYFLQHFGDLSFPPIVVKDCDEFFKEADILEMFIQECCDQVADFDAATNFMDMLQHFNEFAKKFGQKAFHPGNFKKILQAKNLVFAKKKKTSKLKVKLVMKPTVDVHPGHLRN